jgi:hypothetical protein
MANPLAKIAGFADINHRSEPVPHQVNTRLVREAGDFLTNMLGHGHASVNLQAVSRRWQEAPQYKLIATREHRDREEEVN